MANASYANWSPNENYFQTGGAGPGMKDGEYLSGAYMGIFAGPPRLAQIGGGLSLGAALTTPAAASSLVYPIGIIQSYSLSQSQQVARMFELGSERSYQIPGRVVGQVSLGRPMYHGPSMLRALYAYYQDSVAPTLVTEMFANVGASNMVNPHDVITPPGYENLFVNLASDLFKQPIGLLVVQRDSNNATYGAYYLEACYVPNHNLGTDAQGVVVQESMSIQYETLVPIATTAIELMA